MLAAADKAGTYNIATGVATDVTSIWRGLLEAAGRSRVHAKGSGAAELPPILADLRPGELRNSCLDSSRAERELGWAPRVPLEQGLALTYDALVAEYQRA